MWKCKECSMKFSSLFDLLKHGEDTGHDIGIEIVGRRVIGTKSGSDGKPMRIAKAI